MNEVDEVMPEAGQALVMETARMSWVTSPSPGVWRKHLEREAAESGKTTSVVKFDKGAGFQSHVHPLGEEVLRNL